MKEWSSVRRFTSVAKLLSLLALMLIARAVTAQGFAISGQALSSSGVPAAYATVRVCPYTSSGIPCSPTSSIWKDLALTQSISNPYTTDQVGNYTFFAACGSTYIVQIAVGSGVTYSYFESAACASGTIGSGTAGQIAQYPTTGTNVGGVTVSGDATIAIGGAFTVGGIKGFPFCTGFAPTNGQTIELTTASSPNPCYTAVAGSALAITALTGDGSATGPGSTALTLSIVNLAPGCTTISGTAICVNGKGLTTSIGTAFAISSFSCSASGTFEVGYASTNPNTCTYGYTGGTPTSATLTDSASHTGTVNSPYTSGTLAYAYSANTTFYGNASSSTQTATQVSASIAFLPCTFSGLSTGGTATGATASGTATGNICANETAILTGLTGTLASNGLGNTYAGQSFVFSSPGGSYLSLILTGGCGHTLTVGGFTTVFNTHAFTYTNIEGGSQTGMCIYTSPAPASISTTVVVSSL